MGTGPGVRTTPTPCVSIPGPANGEAELEKALGLMARCSAIGDTIGRARLSGATTRDALAPSKPSSQKSALLAVNDFCISRVSKGCEHIKVRAWPAASFPS